MVVVCDVFVLRGFSSQVASHCSSAVLLSLLLLQKRFELKNGAAGWRAPASIVVVWPSAVMEAQILSFFVLFLVFSSRVFWASFEK